MNGKKFEWNWPSREEWAKQVRTLYSDQEGDIRVSERLADYASEAEVQAVVAELKEKYRELGTQMKRVKAQLGDMARRPDETGRQYIHRWLSFPPEVRDARDWPEHYKHDRKVINRTLAEIADGVLPWYWEPARHSPLLTELQGRYRQARSAAIEEKRRKRAQRPIDDAAWQRGLNRRARIEETGGMSIVYVN